MTIVLAAGAALAAGGQSRDARPPLPFKVGQPFPDVVLPDLVSGGPRSIGELRGEKLILHIFASW